MVGDSIFDNEYYINEGGVVLGLLQKSLEHKDKVPLLAENGMLLPPWRVSYSNFLMVQPMYLLAVAAKSYVPKSLTTSSV